MKVNGNDPTFKLSVQEDGGFTIKNTPIRLEIASRILAGNLGWYFDHGIKLGTSFTDEKMTAVALRAADALIKAHNETCGGE